MTDDRIGDMMSSEYRAEPDEDDVLPLLSDGLPSLPDERWSQIVEDAFDTSRSVAELDPHLEPASHDSGVGASAAGDASDDAASTNDLGGPEQWGEDDPFIEPITRGDERVDPVGFGE